MPQRTDSMLRWSKRLGVAAVAFFLIKGLAWLVLAGVAFAMAVT